MHIGEVSELCNWIQLGKDCKDIVASSIFILWTFSMQLLMPSQPRDFIMKVKQSNNQSDLISISSFAGKSYHTI